MRSRVYETVERPSACLSYLSTAAEAAVGPAMGLSNRSIAARRVCSRRGRLSIHIHSSTAVSS